MRWMAAAMGLVTACGTAQVTPGVVQPDVAESTGAASTAPIPDPSGRSWPVTPMSERDLPEGVTPAWLQAACALGPCNGPTSRAIVWRDDQGTAARLYLLGDVAACSHSPAYYVDPEAVCLPDAYEPPERAGRGRGGPPRSDPPTRGA